MVSAEYGLALRLRAGSTAVVAATLSPPEVAVDDIVAAAEGRAQAHSVVVREVRARLAHRLWRGALIKGAPWGVPALPCKACCTPSSSRSAGRLR